MATTRYPKTVRQVPPTSVARTRRGVGSRSSLAIDGTLICAANAKRHVGSAPRVRGPSPPSLTSPRHATDSAGAELWEDAKALAAGSAKSAHGSKSADGSTANRITVTMMMATQPTTTSEAKRSESIRRRKASGAMMGQAARIQNSRAAKMEASSASTSSHSRISGSVSPTTIR